MATVERWTGHEVRILRRALRLSVRGFAEHLGIAARTVSKWEQLGADRCPRPEFQCMLDTVLSRASDEQRERFTTAIDLSVSTTEAEEVADTNRRQFVLSMAAASASALTASVVMPRLTSPQLTELATTLDDVRGHDEADLAAYFAARLAQCQQHDTQSGPAAALMPTLALVAAADIMAHRIGQPVRTELLQLAARGAEFVGWLYRDAGAPSEATYWRDRAVEWAQEASDGPLQSYVLLKKSQAAWDDRDGGRLLALAQAALAGPWPLSNRVRADALQQEARGLAMTGEAADVVRAKLDAAHQALESDTTADHAVDELGAHYNVALLQVQTAMCMEIMGAGSQAVTAFDVGLQPDAFSRRDAGYFTTLKASALATAAEPDEAALLGLSLIEVARGTGSTRTKRELQRLDSTLVAWQDRPLVRDFHEAMSA